jgi:hypothetical protein
MCGIFNIYYYRRSHAFGRLASDRNEFTKSFLTLFHTLPSNVASILKSIDDNFNFHFCLETSNTDNRFKSLYSIGDIF